MLEDERRNLSRCFYGDCSAETRCGFNRDLRHGWRNLIRIGARLHLRNPDMDRAPEVPFVLAGYWIDENVVLAVTVEERYAR